MIEAYCKKWFECPRAPPVMKSPSLQNCHCHYKCTLLLLFLSAVPFRSHNTSITLSPALSSVVPNLCMSSSLHQWTFSLTAFKHNSPLSSSFVFDQQWHSVHWHLVGRQHQSPYLLRWSVCLIWELFYIEYPSWHNPPYLSRLGNTTRNTMACFTSLVEPVMYQSLNKCGFRVHHCHSFTYLAKRTMLYLKASQDIVRCVQCWLLQVFSVDILLKFRIFHILKGPVAKRQKLRKL